MRSASRTRLPLAELLPSGTWTRTLRPARTVTRAEKAKLYVFPHTSNFSTPFAQNCFLLPGLDIKKTALSIIHSKSSRSVAFQGLSGGVGAWADQRVC